MKVLNVVVNIDCLNSENEKCHYVYGIKNKITNKYYIGSTIDKKGIKIRLRRHIYQLLKNEHHSKKLQRSFDKYDKNFDNWEFILFEKINKTNNTKKEQYYIDKFDSYNNGYNNTKDSGKIFSGEMKKSHRLAISLAKQKMSENDIVDIFKKYNKGLNYSEIGKIYNLSTTTISTIINTNHYYTEIKTKYNLKKTYYKYIFYNVIENKFYKEVNISNFCRDNNINISIITAIYINKQKNYFYNNWTLFNKSDFTLIELRNRISINNSLTHILYKDNKKFSFNNTTKFCNQNNIS